MRLTTAILFTLLFLACSDSKELEQKLKSHHWYVKGENWLRDQTAVLSPDSTGGYEWEVEFYPGGKMLYASFYPIDFYDTKGIEHKKGERFVDTAYTYELKEDILKVTQDKESYFLKIKRKNEKEYDIYSANEEDFN
jgi:hypothetical protein